MLSMRPPSSSAALAPGRPGRSTWSPLHAAGSDDILNADTQRLVLLTGDAITQSGAIAVPDLAFVAGGAVTLTQSNAIQQSHRQHHQRR